MSDKVLVWMLGALVGVIMGLSGLVARYHFTQTESISHNLAQIRDDNSASKQQLRDMEHRLDRMEEKLDNIQRWVK